MQTKYEWKNSTVDAIDWYVHGGALHGLPPTTKKTTIQLVHKWLPTNAHPGRTELSFAPKCPYCQEEDKTQQHYLQCPHDLVSTLWEACKEQLRSSLSASKMDPILQGLLL
jgi:hypothetical protein